jgi:endoglycosylceramidase
MKEDADGNPLISECHKHPFFMYYPSPTVSSAWSYFFENKDGVQDKMMRYWEVVSGHFKDNPNIIGYDILNEPWVGNLHRD